MYIYINVHVVYKFTSSYTHLFIICKLHVHTYYIIHDMCTEELFYIHVFIYYYTTCSTLVLFYFNMHKIN